MILRSTKLPHNSECMWASFDDSFKNVPGDKVWLNTPCTALEYMIRAAISTGGLL